MSPRAPFRTPAVTGRGLTPMAATSKVVDLSSTDIMIPTADNDPLLLLPVRLETRFADTPNGPQLLLRIFPDQIAIDSHDPTLSDDEWKAVSAYWKATWPLLPNDKDGQHAAWAELSAQFGPRRAAYLASSTQPTNFDTWVAGNAPGGQVTLSSVAAPIVRPPGTKKASWAQPAVARALPTQWFAALTSGSTTQYVEVTRPKSDLVVSVDPTSGTTDAMQWMFDFNQAVAVGMAVAIDISPDQRSTGFTSIAVFGVTGDKGPAGQSALEDLLTAHRFTDGFAFAPQGTPTKNSVDSVAGYTRQDPTYAKSFCAERRAPLIDTRAVGPADLSTTIAFDGRVFAGALGIDPSCVAHAEHADGCDQQDAVAMATALWPATGDYFLRYLMGYSVPTSIREDVRQFATTYVRARGSVPAFRLGTTPYGVLPITPPLTPRDVGTLGIAANLTATYLAKARPIWETTTQSFPLQVSANAGGNPEQALANVLGRDASTVQVSAQAWWGPWQTWNVGNWLSSLPDPLDAAAVFKSEDTAQGLVVAEIAGLGWGRPTGPGRGMTYAYDLGSNLHVVTSDGEVSETANLPNTHRLRVVVGPRHLPWWQPINALQYVASSSVSELLAVTPDNPDQTLLSYLARHGALLEYASVAADLLGATLTDPEQNQLPPALLANSLLWALGQTTYSVPAGLPAPSGPLGDYLQAQMATPAGRLAFPSLAALLDGLNHLSGRPTAALARALVETLDVCGYRLDAWATALATCELVAMRKKHPVGLSLGVWGYVEQLTPAPPQQPLPAAQLATVNAAGLGGTPASGTTPATPDPLLAPDGNGGFIYAPSLAQAATGAILRTGYLSHANGTFGPSFAIDLSSRRVRTALQIMDGIRQGQHLGALLGYLFETALNAAGLQKYLQSFRALFPIVANKIAQQTGGPVEAVAASNVVDGAALQGAWVSSTIPWGTGGIPPEATPDYVPVAAALNSLSDAVDALSDIAVAESVYQVAKGNPARSGGALNASARDQHAPDPDVVWTPRGGLNFTQRVISTFAVNPTAATPSSSWLGTNPATPRAAAEPWLEQWLSAVLPPPGQVQFQVTYTPAGTTVATTTPLLSLTFVGLSALDLLALAPPAPTGAAATALDGSELVRTDLGRWILCQCAAAGALPAGAQGVSVTYGRGALSAAPITIPELLTLARSLQELVRAARPITSVDLVPPGSIAAAFDLDLSAVIPRVVAAYTAFAAFSGTLASTVATLSAATTLTAANGDTLSGLLMNATQYGIAGAAPVTFARDTGSLAALLAQATTVNAVVARRLSSLQQDGNLFASGTLQISTPGTTPTFQTVQDTARAVFGAVFTVMPAITATPGDAVAAAIGDMATAIAAWPSVPGSNVSAATALQQLTHIRPPIARLDEATTLGAVLNQAPAPKLAVAQLYPYDASVPWLGAGPVTPNFPWPHKLQGKYALLVWTPPSLLSTPNATNPSLCGLIFDEWIEQIPNSVEKTAVAFHYAEPGARAPQSLLLAVKPGAWSAKTALDTVLEAAALAKIRTVDPQTLELGGKVGQLLPALFGAVGPGTIASLLDSLQSPSNPWGL